MKDKTTKLKCIKRTLKEHLKDTKRTLKEHNCFVLSFIVYKLSKNIIDVRFTIVKNLE